MAQPPLWLPPRGPRAPPPPQLLPTSLLPATSYAPAPGRDRPRALQPGDALAAKSGGDRRPSLLSLSQAQPTYAHCPRRSSPSPQPGHPPQGGHPRPPSHHRQVRHPSLVPLPKALGPALPLPLPEAALLPDLQPRPAGTAAQPAGTPRPPAPHAPGAEPGAGGDGGRMGGCPSRLPPAQRDSLSPTQGC